jgi:hypothetical protein
MKPTCLSLSAFVLESVLRRPKPGVPGRLSPFASGMTAGQAVAANEAVSSPRGQAPSTPPRRRPEFVPAKVGSTECDRFGSSGFRICPGFPACRLAFCRAITIRYSVVPTSYNHHNSLSSKITGIGRVFAATPITPSGTSHYVRLRTSSGMAGRWFLFVTPAKAGVQGMPSRRPGETSRHRWIPAP